MNRYEYKSYTDYKEAQIDGYKNTESTAWVNVAHIKDVIVPYIYDYNPDVSFGLCHGVGNGKEQEAFTAGFQLHDKNVEVIGTEIAPEASAKYPNTIEWDFQKVKDEWISSVDFIYSNALNHSIGRGNSVSDWMRCLNEKGLCIIEWSIKDEESNKFTPHGATRDEYERLFKTRWSVDIIDKSPRIYFVLKNKRYPWP